MKYKITLHSGEEIEVERLRNGNYYGNGKMYTESEIKTKEEIKDYS